MIKLFFSLNLHLKNDLRMYLLRMFPCGLRCDLQGRRKVIKRGGGQIARNDPGGYRPKGYFYF